MVPERPVDLKVEEKFVRALILLQHNIRKPAKMAKSVPKCHELTKKNYEVKSNYNKLARNR